MTIRNVAENDLDELLNLYQNHLSTYHPENPLSREYALQVLNKIMSNSDYHIIIGDIDGRIVSSVTVIIVPNLTHGHRPYAVIENVVTHSDYRNKGYATALMEYACKLAEKTGCYKVMLMTGSKKESTLRFYENCGFNSKEKTGFIRRFE